MTNNIELAKKKYLRAKKVYYNDSKPLMTDKEFDALEDWIKRKDPNWIELQKTGVPVRNKKKEVDLLECMPSLTKHYPHQVDKFIEKRKDIIVMDKMDGSSLQLVYENGKPTRLMTRGNGIRGQDISYLIPHLTLPQSIKAKNQIVFRCEAVLPLTVFDAYKRDKELLKGKKEEFNDARTMVNGILNRQLKGAVHPIYKQIDIMVLGVYGSTILAALKFAENMGFSHVVYHTAVRRQELNGDWLCQFLQLRKKKNIYDIDGLVLCDNTYQYNLDEDKPKWMTAFKDNNEETTAVSATVEKIIWQISRHGRIIPKIFITPTRVGSVRVKHATANNAKWMIDRGIGPGAVVNIVRSGDVIPKIIGVTKKGKLQYPDVDYEWDGVHLVTTEISENQQVKQISNFLRRLKVDFIASGTVQKMFDAGVATKPMDYLRIASKKEVKALHKAGLGPNISQKIIDELNLKLSKVEIKDLAVASGCFGVGSGLRRITALSDAGLTMTKLLKDEYKNMQVAIKKVPGFSDKTAAGIVSGLASFRKFVKEAQQYTTLYDHTNKEKKKEKASKAVSTKLAGCRVSWTGYRSSDEEAWVEANGGEVVSFSTRKTTHLLYRDNGKRSSKLQKATSAGMSLLQFNELQAF